MKEEAMFDIDRELNEILSINETPPIKLIKTTRDMVEDEITKKETIQKNKTYK